MSIITHVIIIGHFHGDEKIKAEKLLTDFEQVAFPFIPVDTNKAAGGKVFIHDLYIGSFNCIDDKKFRKMIAKFSLFLDVHDFETMQIGLQNEHDSWYTFHFAHELEKEHFWTQNEYDYKKNKL